jgi:hypothetical protein
MLFRTAILPDSNHSLTYDSTSALKFSDKSNRGAGLGSDLFLLGMRVVKLYKSFIKPETNEGLKNHRRRATRKRGDDRRGECRQEGGHGDQENEEGEEHGNGGLGKGG